MNAPAFPAEFAEATGTAQLNATALAAAVEAATRKVAPLWPLKHFVAVNPFLGLSGQSFAQALGTMARAAGARMLMPRSFYAEAIATGRIADADLAEALRRATPAPGLPRTVAELRALAAAGETPEAPALTPTVADVAAAVSGKDWAQLAADRISAWAAARFDEGQASWRDPWRDLPLFAAWRTEAALDRTPELMGLKGFRATVQQLPGDAGEAIAAIVARLGIPPAGLEAYLHRLLMTIGGWAAYARYRVWEKELYGATDATLVELLAVRLAWELAIHEAVLAQGNEDVWAGACARLETPAEDADAACVDLVLQAAYEHAWQAQLIARVAAREPGAAPARKAVQAAFCIDVRSEIYRRALETVTPEVETIGFAGFFGFPIEYVPLGSGRGGAQCPVLLTPKFTVCEEVRHAGDLEEKEILGLRVVRQRAGRVWKSFKLAAVSSFAFVETMGLASAAKLATDSFRLTRTVPHPMADGLDADTAARLGPCLHEREVEGRLTGFAPDTKLAMAEAVLKAMSMRDGFARLVLLTGHGSTTVNNPHATGLDCGACGGHTGEANARVAAAILGDPEVRKGLAARGIAIPEDTLFLGCLHDTTTDEIAIFDADQVPASHAEDLAQLRKWLDAASHLARLERSGLLGISNERGVDRAVKARASDWSQVRPEWGLAGCAGFIAAPRHRTQGLDLGGRCFLHSYEWRQDEGFGVLELIMTAPMVVASWISLQYYGSTVDNRAFGSGNKVLHNVVGTVGVLEGNGGDLRVGLPWQSVHDGLRLIHEPVRLSVVIEAPLEAMNAVIAKHAGVRDLLDHGWLHLFAMDEAGRIAHRYAGGLNWEPIEAPAAALAA